MKIGIYFGKNIYSDPVAGGAYTFQQSIISALLEMQTNHEIFIFSDDAEAFKNNEIFWQSRINFIKLERYFSEDNESIFKKFLFKIPRKIKRISLNKNYKTALNKAVLQNNIDLVWFASPAYEYVEVPYIYTVWDLQHRVQSYFPEVSVSGWTYDQREARYSSVIPRVYAVITGNDVGKKEIIDFYRIPENRVKIVEMPVADFFLNAKRLSENTPRYIFAHAKTLGVSAKNYLFYPAQFWPHKNHIVILLALKILKEKYNLDFDVVFTGCDKGNLDYIKEKSKELNLDQNIKFLGFVSQKELVNLYQNAFALVFASFFGPDNIPPLEAFALGSPVIAANYAGSEIQLGDAAILFDPKNELELAEAIKKLYLSQELRKDLISKGFDRVKNLDSKNYLKKIFKIVDEFEPIRRCWSYDKIYTHK